VLTLKLKAGDSLQIGESIRLVVKEDSSKGRLTVGIDAPRDINIARVPVAPKAKDDTTCR
jgi:sRNA-binding carbon storage regulator CsrA